MYDYINPRVVSTTGVVEYVIVRKINPSQISGYGLAVFRGDGSPSFFSGLNYVKIQSAFTSNIVTSTSYVYGINGFNPGNTPLSGRKRYVQLNNIALYAYEATGAETSIMLSHGVTFRGDGLLNFFTGRESYESGPPLVDTIVFRNQINHLIVDL